jgi:hypothetical protein
MCLIDLKHWEFNLNFKLWSSWWKDFYGEAERAKTLSTEMGEMLTIQEHRTARCSKQALCAQLLTQVTGLPPWMKCHWRCRSARRVIALHTADILLPLCMPRCQWMPLTVHQCTQTPKHFCVVNHREPALCLCVVVIWYGVILIWSTSVLFGTSGFVGSLCNQWKLSQPKCLYHWVL